MAIVIMARKSFSARVEEKLSVFYVLIRIIIMFYLVGKKFSMMGIKIVMNIIKIIIIIDYFFLIYLS